MCEAGHLLLFEVMCMKEAVCDCVCLRDEWDMLDLGQAKLRNPWHPHSLMHMFIEQMSVHGLHVPRNHRLKIVHTGMRLNTVCTVTTTGWHLMDYSHKMHKSRLYNGFGSNMNSTRLQDVLDFLQSLFDACLYHVFVEKKNSNMTRIHAKGKNRGSRGRTFLGQWQPQHMPPFVYQQ